MKQEYTENGYYLVQGTINEETVFKLRDETSDFIGKTNNYGVRDILNKLPFVKSMVSSSPLIDIAKDILGKNARPVRSVFFDKVREANWNVAWHQDTSIVVKSKHEIEGFGPWTEKQGVIHTEPPERYLSNTLTLRIHLDDSNTETGGLRIVPGTHKNGRVQSKEILKIVENAKVIECNASAGDVLLMNPLLFHSSRKAINPTHRRIIHIEYSAMELPEPLEWFECA